MYVLSVGPVFGYYRTRDWNVPEIVLRAYRPIFRTYSGPVMYKYLGLFGVPEIETYFLVCCYYPEKIGPVRE